MLVRRTTLRRPLGRRLAVLALAVALGATAVGGPASSDEIGDARSEAERVTDRIEELQHESEVLTEQFLDAQLARARIDEQVAEASERAARSRRQLSALRGDLREVAVESYMSGGERDAGALFGVADAGELTRRRGYVASVGADGDDLIDRYRGVEAEASADAAELRRLKGEAERNERAIATGRDATEESLTELRRVEREVTGRLADLVEQEQRRRDEARRRAAAERAARLVAATPPAPPAPVDEGGAAPESRPEASEPSSTTTTTAPAPSDPAPPAPEPEAPSEPAPPPSGSGAQAAIAAARSVLGTPYKWAGASPEAGFDCSGLTMWAWNHGGKSLPHSSSAQYAMSRKIPVSELQPGDLVFYNSPISHVGLYIGGGQMIHAPHTGSVVEIQSIHYWSALVGGGRI